MFDPLDRPAITTYSLFSHMSKSQNLGGKTNNFQVRIVNATGGTMDLAEGIIVSSYSI